MYTKITHNIVEEHFAHPSIMPRQVQPNQLSDGGAPLPGYVMNESTMLFRMDARTAWGKWVWSLMNYSISLNGNLPGTAQVKSRFGKNAAALGDYIVPYYGLTAGDMLTSSLIAIGEVGVDYVDALQKKLPTADIAAKWPKLIDDLVKFLNELNPGNWPVPLLTDIFNHIVSGWTDMLNARAKGDILADELAIDAMNKLVITGLPDHVKHGFSSLSDIFSRGIVAQFPGMFSE